jgi:two-component system chemotaxis sensor kinase CheA
MPRLVRESARDLGKRVRLITVGEATEIDNTVVERLADPLTHMIRNAVDHGVEPPAERRAASKPEEATISLTAAHRSGRITIEVSDDGRGIDRDKVYRRAVERGLIDKGAALADDEILDLIFLPGFSTAEAVTDLSGRGVGMDVVRRNIGQIGGRVIIDSQPGVGTRFLISLPLTLAVMDGMIVSVGNERYVLPLGCILESIRPLPDQVSTIAGAELLVRFRDEYVPLLFLHRLFGVTGACDDPCKGLVVFVETDTGSVIGIVVDNLLGERQVVIKSMEENFRRIEGASAATILGDGQVALILEVNGIHGMYRAATRQPPAASAAPGAK